MSVMLTKKKKHEVTFDDFVLLCPRKQVMEDRDLGVQLEVDLECGTSISLGRKDTV